MSNYYYNNPYYKNYYLPQCIGPGSLGNNQVGMCRVCSQNGYPHEAIVIRAQKLVNYYDGSEHVHKQISDNPKAWEELWSSSRSR